MTTVSLAVVRGPVALAKTLAAIDVLSGGRLVAGLGPGSTAADFDAVGVPFEQRWARFDEAVMAMRALWRGEDPPPGGFYRLAGTILAPAPLQHGGPPIFIGSWGSDAGLRRVALLGDGWLASGYNTTPERFVEARRRLGDLLAAEGRDGRDFPDAIATMWIRVTENRTERAWVLDRLAQLLRRDRSDLAATLPIGAAGHCAEIVARYREAGAERIIFWPVGDELRQLDRIGML
jgi:alkanesulfonate monooxygenase SsuD/methylene tetrahydromethanopterin reductase-like flavin-dependent oxidoreductase (luciferase family)